MATWLLNPKFVNNQPTSQFSGDADKRFGFRPTYLSARHDDQRLLRRAVSAFLIPPVSGLYNPDVEPR